MLIEKQGGMQALKSSLLIEFYIFDIVSSLRSVNV